MMTMDIGTQIFTILKQQDVKYLTQVSSMFKGKTYRSHYQRMKSLVFFVLAVNIYLLPKYMFF